MLEPVRASLRDNKPLVWTRVNRLPDYAYFNHSVHVTKGVGCSTCHGNMTAMQLTAKANALEMSWCINCHRNPAANLRPQSDIYNMAWTPPADQDTLGPALARQYHIGQPEKMTDCSICHR